MELLDGRIASRAPPRHSIVFLLPEILYPRHQPPVRRKINVVAKKPSQKFAKGFFTRKASCPEHARMHVQKCCVFLVKCAFNCEKRRLFAFRALLFASAI